MSKADEIRERWGRVTPGLWFWAHTNCLVAGESIDPDGEWTLVLPVNAEVDDWDSQPDKDAIAAAPTDIAYLLAENERLREALERIGIRALEACE